MGLSKKIKGPPRNVSIRPYNHEFSFVYNKMLYTIDTYLSGTRFEICNLTTRKTVFDSRDKDYFKLTKDEKIIFGLCGLWLKANMGLTLAKFLQTCLNK